MEPSNFFYVSMFVLSCFDKVVMKRLGQTCTGHVNCPLYEIWRRLFLLSIVTHIQRWNALLIYISRLKYSLHSCIRRLVMVCFSHPMFMGISLERTCCSSLEATTSYCRNFMTRFSSPPRSCQKLYEALMAQSPYSWNGYHTLFSSGMSSITTLAWFCWCGCQSVSLLRTISSQNSQIMVRHIVMGETHSISEDFCVLGTKHPIRQSIRLCKFPQSPLWQSCIEQSLLILRKPTCLWSRSYQLRLWPRLFSFAALRRLFCANPWPVCPRNTFQYVFRPTIWFYSHFIPICSFYTALSSYLQ